MGKEIRSFEQRGLARAVGADKDVPRGTEIELEPLEWAEILESQLSQAHAIPAPRLPVRDGAA